MGVRNREAHSARCRVRSNPQQLQRNIRTLAVFSKILIELSETVIVVLVVRRLLNRKQELILSLCSAMIREQWIGKDHAQLEMCLGICRFAQEQILEQFTGFTGTLVLHKDFFD